MSFLAPLYFLGALAIAGPIVFHLIRRQPKGEVEFSSLMFLDSTPPRLTRRSRLENWPLLLLRCAAIMMLAFAFARPFLPLTQSDSVEGVRQAVVLLVDQSASMKRTGLWDQAIKRANAILDESDGETLISVIAFDAQTHTALSLEESTGLDAAARKDAARDALERLAPTWQATNLGQAIRYAADQATLLELGDTEDTSNAPNDQSASAALDTRIVLLSDLQKGAAIETLQGYEWPDRVWLDVETLNPTTFGNVSLRVLPQPTGGEQTDATRDENSNAVRVQVSQSEDGNDSTFRLRFDDQEEDAAVIQVPPGQTRFFSVPLPAVAGNDAETLSSATLSSATLRVFGDSDDFDNSFHFIRPKRINQNVLFMDSRRQSNDGADAVRETLSFYSEQLPWSDATREVEFSVTSSEAWERELDASETPLLMMDATGDLIRHAESVEKYLQSGGRVLIVLDRAIDEGTRDAIASLLDAPEMQVDEADVSDYRLISSVDFKTALIAPLSEPGVNDFSNIRVWKHRKLSGLNDRTNVTLKLDDGSPLLVRRDFESDDEKVPSGKLWVLSAGWQPAQSQLALSTKFVPIMLGMLGPNRHLAPESGIVGDSVGDSDGTDRVATEPGIIALSDDTEIAINLDPVESQTLPIDMDRLAEFGAVISSLATREQGKTAERALRDIELEARQGWWQWLILATLGLIAAETLLAARNPQNNAAQNNAFEG